MRATIAAIAAALAHASTATAAALPSGDRPVILQRTAQTSPNVLSSVITRAEGDKTQGGAFVSASDITQVSGTFRIPDLSQPIRGPTTGDADGFYSASMWVGIGALGDCPKDTSTLRAGIELFYDRFIGGPLPPFAWYQYGSSVSNTAFAFVGFGATFGDLVRVTVAASASGPGDVTIENFGKVDSTVGRQPISSSTPTFGLGDGGGQQLCRSNAGWVVEDFPLVGTPDVPTPLANFTDITFDELKYSAGGAGARDASAATVLNIDIQNQGGKLTDCSAVGASSVKCRRTLDGA